MDLLTTGQAAEVLGMSERGIRKLIDRGRLRSRRVGRNHLISARDLRQAEYRPGPGRPAIKKGSRG